MPPPRRRWQKTMHFGFPLAWGEGLITRWGLLPHRVPLSTVVGPPLELPRWEGPCRGEEFDKAVEAAHARWVLRELAWWGYGPCVSAACRERVLWAACVGCMQLRWLCRGRAPALTCCCVCIGRWTLLSGASAQPADAPRCPLPPPAGTCVPYRSCGTPTRTSLPLTGRAR